MFMFAYIFGSLLLYKRMTAHATILFCVFVTYRWSHLKEQRPLAMAVMVSLSLDTLMAGRLEMHLFCLTPKKKLQKL